MLLPNCPQFLIAELGAWKLGAIVAPINPIYTEHEIEGPLREHRIETIVTQEPTVQTWAAEDGWRVTASSGKTVVLAR